MSGSVVLLYALRWRGRLLQALRGHATPVAGTAALIEAEAEVDELAALSWSRRRRA